MENLEPVGLGHFFGGMSSDKQLGTSAQFYYSRHIDFRKNPSSFTLLPQPSNADGGIVADLVQDMTQVNSGVRYSVGDAGYVYKTTTGGVWSVVSQLGENGGAGIIHRADVDHVYITGQSKVARIKRVATDATFEQNWFSKGASTSTTCTLSGGTASYTTLTSISENTVDKRSFTSDIEPLYQIGIFIRDAGTGNWTLTLHDDANNSLGTVTITNANIVENAINYFVFSTPIRIQRGDNGGGSALTYHFHVTSTVADGTLACANNLSDCDMELWASALVTTNNGLHPIMNFSNLTLIGNGRYVASYEPLQDSPTTADFNRHRITLPPGFEVCGFAQKNLMCVIGAEKRSSSGDFQEGMLFFWDGIADTYNDYWPVPEGAPESLFSHKNVVYFIAGGALYRMRGGDEPIKIRTFRNTDSEYSGTADVTHVYPNMMTVRRGILLIGYPSTTTNQSLEHGVYSYGAITSDYPDSFGFSYTTSNGNMTNNGSNNLKIGMIKSYGDTLYISWRDDDAAPQKYSVDIVNNSSSPAASGTLETLEFDDGRPFAYKKASYLIATFDELSNSTVTLKYKIDGAANWTSGSAVSSGTYAITPVTNVGGGRYQSIQFAIDVTCTGSTSPRVTGLYLMTDLLKKERPIGG